MRYNLFATSGLTLEPICYRQSQINNEQTIGTHPSAFTIVVVAKNYSWCIYITAMRYLYINNKPILTKTLPATFLGRSFELMMLKIKWEWRSISLADNSFPRTPLSCPLGKSAVDYTYLNTLLVAVVWRVLFQFKPTQKTTQLAEQHQQLEHACDEANPTTKTTYTAYCCRYATCINSSLVIVLTVDAKAQLSYLNYTMH